MSLKENFKTIVDRVVVSAQRYRRVVAALVYVAITTVAMSLAYLSRFDFDLSSVLSPMFARGLLLLVGVRLGVNYFYSLGLSRWRYVGTRDILRLLFATTTGSLVFSTLIWGLGSLISVPASIIFLEWVFTGYMTASLWILYRLLYEFSRVRKGLQRRKVLVVGAGEAAQLLISQMLRSGAGYTPVGIVDDDRFKRETRIHGVEVYGAIKDAGTIASQLQAEEIVIGVPSATSKQLRKVVEYCESAELPIKILPGMDDVLDGNTTLSQLRELQLEDLLGRAPVTLELPRLAKDLRGHTVLVTGAAGSIGSELARQIALNNPQRLILYDQAETPLYYLELELGALVPGLDIVPIVADVTDRNAVREAFEHYHPQKVFHAAAYKHVPLMESNQRSAILTNIFGTFTVALVAAQTGAKDFLLVSTDKAVRPHSIMGATKHLAERVVLNLQNDFPATVFGAVRFGNVLGSSGSVIPLFKQQLEAGKPLTVTNEEITRYFMTIPEAVQLILKTSLLESFGGQIAMLDMGEPVKIIDLARNMLRLSGRPFRLGENVIITGLRPGEKMHEELADPDELVHETDEGRVFLVETPPVFSELPYPLLASLRDGDLAGLLEFLTQEFPEMSWQFEDIQVDIPVSP